MSLFFLTGNIENWGAVAIISASLLDKFGYISTDWMSMINVGEA